MEKNEQDFDQIQSELMHIISSLAKLRNDADTTLKKVMITQEKIENLQSEISMERIKKEELRKEMDSC